MNEPLRLVISDLDGTLRRSDERVSAEDHQTLVELGRRGIHRVLATGRTVHSCREVLGPDFPIDYLIFSTGAGVSDWRTGELLRALHLTESETARIAALLMQRGLDFMWHAPIPDNHHFVYHHSGRDNPDFQRRCRKHAQISTALSVTSRPSIATQFLVIEPPETGGERHAELTRALPEFSVVRATSPLDGKSTWVEVFPASVTKGQACHWLADRLGVTAREALAVGNDYNDLDLLQWVKYPFIVSNAPAELRRLFPNVSSNDDNGFSQAVRALASISR